MRARGTVSPAAPGYKAAGICSNSDDFFTGNSSPGRNKLNGNFRQSGYSLARKFGSYEALRLITFGASGGLFLFLANL
ncbi:MAG: hypothetical protein ABTB30_09965, partial [Clostridia bacterium]